MTSDIVSIDPEVMHGTPVFKGTRVPVEFLFEFFESDSTVDDFVDEFPTVRKTQVLKFLECLKQEYSFQPVNLKIN